MEIGLLGGTFDPVHLGHLIIAEEVRCKLGLSKIVFIPAGQPWLKVDRVITRGEHRLAMLRMAIGSNPCFEVSLAELERSGPSYSVDTVSALRKEHGPEVGLYFIVGHDALVEFHRWKEPVRLAGLCWLIAVGRPNSVKADLRELEVFIPAIRSRIRCVDVPEIGISSTEIRERVGMGLSIRYLVPPEVERYIHEHQLYLPRQSAVSSQQSTVGSQQSSVGGGEGDYRLPTIDYRLSNSAKEADVATDIERVKRLLELVKEKSFLYGDFTLSSGIKSSYYFDGRLTTLWPEGAYLVGKTVFELIRDAGIDAIGGPSMGADPIVAAVALVSHLEGQPIPAFMVRTEPKKHGTQRYIEGHLPPGGTVAIVDDVITTGGSVFRAIEAVEAQGCRVEQVVVLLDRNQGGADELRRRGYHFAALLCVDDQGQVTL